MSEVEVKETTVTVRVRPDGTVVVNVQPPKVEEKRIILVN
jgi:hypothetical protein